MRKQEDERKKALEEQRQAEEERRKKEQEDQRITLEEARTSSLTEEVDLVMLTTPKGGTGVSAVPPEEDELAKAADEDETRALVEADGRVAIHCAEWDAISDVKRALEARFSEAWDLVGRPRDRDGCFAGWELVSGETPLGPHFFVGDYGLKRGDIVHAVVRRRG